MTNRAYILSALASGPSTITGALRSRDTDLMEAALQAMGTGIRRDGETIHVTPGPLRSADVYCGLAGTVMRFVPPVAAFAEGPVLFSTATPTHAHAPWPQSWTGCAPSA